MKDSVKEIEMNSSLNIKELIASMTLKEKVGQLNQKLYGWNTFKKTNDGYELTEEFKEHVKWGGGIGTLYGVFRADAWSGISLEPGQNSSGQMGINIYGMNSEANGDEMCITIKNGTEPYAVLLIETRYSD